MPVLDEDVLVLLDIIVVGWSVVVGMADDVKSTKSVVL